MTGGSVTLNGVSDEALAIAFKFKSEHEGLFGFNPQQMQAQAIAQGANKPPKTIYNGMTFTWGQPAGLKAVIEMLQKLEHHHSGHQGS